MKKMLIVLLFLSLTVSVCTKEKNETRKLNVVAHGDNLIWNYGVAIINGKAKYIDPKKLDQSEMVSAKSLIDKYRNDKKEIIKAGKLLWDIDNGERVFVYNTKVNEPYIEDFESKKEYYIKIENNTTLISPDKQKWEEISIEILQDKPQHSDDVNEPTIYMIIRLKCKFFEGDYEIIGTTG